MYVCIVNLKHRQITTLVIHPKDESTDFLSPIYESVEDKLVVTGGKTKEELKKLIETHDRILIMGHGTPHGLLNFGSWNIDSGHIIDYTFVELLEQKPNTMYIWCNADQFVEYHKLSGFYSGMFVSEVGESQVFIPFTKVEQPTIDESNDRFSEFVSQHIDKPMKEIHKEVKKEYSELNDTNPVIRYNSERLYYRE